MAKKGIRFAWVMAEFQGRKVLMSYKNGPEGVITSNNLGMKRDFIVIGTEKELLTFFAIRRRLVTRTKQIGVKIKKVPLLKGPSLAQSYLLNVLTLGLTGPILTVLKNAATVIDVLNCASTQWEVRVSEAAKTRGHRFSTLDMMVDAPSITGAAFANALYLWFKKQTNVSHNIKSVFRSSTLPYYVKQGGSLAAYGATAASGSTIRYDGPLAWEEDDDEDD